MKKYRFGEKLQHRKLNLVLIKTANCETGAVSNQAVFVKYYPDFKLSKGNLARKLNFYFMGNILGR